MKLPSHVNSIKTTPYHHVSTSYKVFSLLIQLLFCDTDAIYGRLSMPPPLLVCAILISAVFMTVILDGCFIFEIVGKM